MPRPNQPRSIASEAALARHIASLRERKQMTYEGLALRMTKAGCPIQASGLYKIEKGDPPRRITVDELVAFSRVFGIPVEQLLMPPEVAMSRELGELVVAWDAARDAAMRAKSDEDAAWERLRTYLEDHPDASDALEPIMRLWVEYYFDEEKREGVLSMWMHELTRADKWADRVREYVNRGA